MKNTPTITRGQFGEITTPEIVAAGRSVLDIAIRRNVLEEEFYRRLTRTNREALNYDIYDQDDEAWLVQQRYTSISKYGTSAVRNYFILRRQGANGVAVETVEHGRKPGAQRAPRGAGHLGEALRKLQGEALNVPGVKRPAGEPVTCYKLVAVVGGEYRSIYDNDTRYEIGIPLEQKATGNHGGGYYVYATEAAARQSEFPEDSDNLTAPRVLLEIVCSGGSVEYDKGKIAYSRVAPSAVVEI